MAMYIVVEAGDTVKVKPVCPFDQLTVPAHEAAVRSVDSPAQILLSVVLITGAIGNGLTVTGRGSELPDSHWITVPEVEQVA